MLDHLERGKPGVPAATLSSLSIPVLLFLIFIVVSHMTKNVLHLHTASLHLFCCPLHSHNYYIIIIFSFIIEFVAGVVLLHYYEYNS